MDYWPARLIGQGRGRFACSPSQQGQPVRREFRLDDLPPRHPPVATTYILCPLSSTAWLSVRSEKGPTATPLGLGQPRLFNGLCLSSPRPIYLSDYGPVSRLAPAMCRQAGTSTQHPQPPILQQPSAPLELGSCAYTRYILLGAKGPSCSSGSWGSLRRRRDAPPLIPTVPRLCEHSLPGGWTLGAARAVALRRRPPPSLQPC